MKFEISTINLSYIEQLDSKQLNSSRDISMKISALHETTSLLF